MSNVGFSHTGNVGFLRFRRGIIDQFWPKGMTCTEFACLSAIILLADPATGIWRGSAGWLSMLFNQSVSRRTLCRALRGLEVKGFITCFKSAGKPCTYPILVDNYEVSTGPKRGLRIDAQRTTDWRTPAFQEEDQERGKDQESGQDQESGLDQKSGLAPADATNTRPICR